ncbi:hypothetical protein K505DRAFT_364839 [Melanomma pulvis-pyrius CBS 109.77]|uniref:Rhodopsin domain-containing protein n=1 Tax=Melanomma pulvis-pyrius CBS 109.77 TaxID=1314802 RepID=A0A6A6X1T6_9PLEO|nr:hypothetical protein K505DRAFT_364839 [Melanomma pulvis-pyrius CBS 109.77]
MFSSESTHYITTNTQATGVGISTWFLMSVSMIMYLSRQAVKFVMLRKVQLDDYLMSAAMLLSLGLSLGYSFASEHGFGNEFVASGDRDSIQKAYYAADVLYIPSLCLVKLALVVFFNNIAVDERQKRIILCLGGFSTLSMLATLFAASFQCGTQRAWEVMTLHCFNQSAFWIAHGVLDMITDMSLILVSFMLVWNLHIPLARKAVVVGCFAPRVLVIAAAACRVAYLAPTSAHNNPTFALWKSAVCAEVQICLSISTACMPCIKPFFAGIEAGVWQADQLRRQGLSLDDLYNKGYVKKNTEGDSSERSESLPKSKG